MSSQLQQILDYLDQETVTEVVLGVGRKIAIRQNGGYASLTPKPITRDQLLNLLKGTPLLALLPDGDATRPPVEVAVFGRRLRTQVTRKADDLLLRIERAPVPKRDEVSFDLDVMELELEPTETPAPDPRKRTKLPTVHPRTKPATVQPRTKEPSAPPRTKAPSAAPRTRPATAARGMKSTRMPKLSSSGRAKKSTTMPAIENEIDFSTLVARARERGASDLHISSGRPISIRTIGTLEALDSSSQPLSVSDAESLLLPLLEPAHEAQLARAGYIDLAIDAPGGGRLRANISRHQRGLKGTFRLALAEPKTLDQLGLPKDLAKVIAHHQGFVVIAGPSGHGKTTTLAALVDAINSTKPYHILTIEDPIEIVHPRKVAVVSQREAGRHTKSFVTALKASLREDPDVIVIGELRDRESVEIALTAAETGHLVISTMSTPNASKTLDRLIDMFPPEDHSQVRASIAGALRGIVAQRLLPAADGKSVVAAVELLTGVLPLAALIRDDKLYQLPNLMQRGRAFGMMRFDDSLLELLRAGKITEATALEATDNKKEMLATLKPPPASVIPPSAGVQLGRLFGKKDR
ncbi:MAG: pilT4 [Myxococcales bacterium]|nr:pilT4 [Myxococcales bacterium]